VTDVNLISPAERQALLDAVERRAGQLSEAAIADFTARVNAAQTHAGLDTIRQDLPPEPPTPVARPPRQLSWPMLSLPKLAWPTISLARRDPWSLIPHAVFAVATIGGIVKLISDRDHDDETTRPPAEPPAATVTSRPATTTTTAPSTTTTTTSPSTTIPRPAFSPPTVLQVGTDIQPGRFVSVSRSCYWERWSDVLLINDSSDDGHAIVDVLPTDERLISRSCAWQPYEPPPAPATTITNGDWVVGEDIQPGRYRSSASDYPSCTWERAQGFTRDGGTLTATATSHGTVEVRVVAGERFTSKYCGAWTKVG
jgi:hypothetical protein